VPEPKRYVAGGAHGELAHGVPERFGVESVPHAAVEAAARASKRHDHALEALVEPIGLDHLAGSDHSLYLVITIGRLLRALAL
jgi:hypothetical protein